MMDEEFFIDESYLKKLSEKYKDVEHPLFMSELPRNIEENKDLEALYNLMIADENSISLAKNYKSVGNDYFKDGPKYFDDAIISYNKGIDVLVKYVEEINKSEKNKNNDNYSISNDIPVICNLNKLNKRITPNNHDENINTKTHEEKKENNIQEEVKQLMADLHNNVAIVYMKKKMYVKCINHCKKALFYNQKKFKALYNCILCSYYLELFCDACKYINMFDELIKKEEEIKSIVNISEYGKLKTKILSKYKNILNKKKEEELEKKKKLETETKTLNQIKDILKKRNVDFVESVYNNNNITPILYIDENLYIHFTVYLIYFEMNCIETILDFPENSTILDYYEN